MPRYYCDYCDTYLTHDSPSVRKQHNAGYKHKANVRTYYQQFEEQQTQSLIDQRIKEHLSGQAAFGIGASYAAWRPGVRPPMLPVPLSIPGQVPPNVAMAPVPRLPVFPRPVGVPVYGTAPITMPGAGNPGAPATPLQPNGLPGPPPMTAPTSAHSNGALPGPPQSSYHGAPTGGSFSVASMPAPPSFPSSGGTPSEVPDSFTYAQAPNNNH